MSRWPSKKYEGGTVLSSQSQRVGWDPEQLLKSRFAPWLTHLGLAVLTSLFFALLIQAPFWLAFIPGVLLAHRIGVLLHEYFHGIPFRRYRHNLAVVTFFDGLLLMFGLLEVFRRSHLAHHRWLNTELDPTRDKSPPSGASVRDRLIAHPIVQNLIYLRDQFREEQRYVHNRRMLLGFVLAAVTVLTWWLLGHPEVVWKTIAVIVFTTVVPVSMRGAIEHYSYAGDSNFANEYRVLIPLLNINRHIHHHEEPSVPWYLLKFRTEYPLPKGSSFIHWFRVNVKRDFVLMQPMKGRVAKSTSATKSGAFT